MRAACTIWYAAKTVNGKAKVSTGIPDGQTGNLVQLESVRCPICAHPQFEILIGQAKEQYIGLPFFFDVVCCKNCGFTYTNPRPTPESMSHFYPDSAAYFQPQSQPVTNRHTWRTWLRDGAMAYFFGYPNTLETQGPLSKLFFSLFGGPLLHMLQVAHVPIHVERGKMLDIGCAWGGYLQRMERLGWETYGIEMNEASAKHARSILKTGEIFVGTIESVPLKHNEFDVVHGSMVLEHIADPLTALQKMHAVLKKNGQLILSVPNFSGFEFRVFGRYCYALQVPQHLNHFVPKSLALVLKSQGFEIRNMVFERVDRDILASMGIWKKAETLRRILSNGLVRRLVLKPFVWLLSATKLTSRMTIYAVKL
jgi:2-polyprenyl-3-methyl-5-hydroxy-6-metoxy-1,4-benzoquinol methylase